MDTRKKILAHVLWVNLKILGTHVCYETATSQGCSEGFDLGISIESKWDWLKNVSPRRRYE